MRFGSFFSFFFFFNDTATTEIYTLSLHDALPIYHHGKAKIGRHAIGDVLPSFSAVIRAVRSEEHTSELQSRLHLVCRLLLEKKKKKNIHIIQINMRDIRTTATLKYKEQNYVTTQI